MDPTQDIKHFVGKLRISAFLPCATYLVWWVLWRVNGEKSGKFTSMWQVFCSRTDVLHSILQAISAKCWHIFDTFKFKTQEFYACHTCKHLLRVCSKKKKKYLSLQFFLCCFVKTPGFVFFAGHLCFYDDVISAFWFGFISLEQASSSFLTGV